ncbi:MAG: HAD family hydrolase [Pleurocapsa sp.]
MTKKYPLPKVIFLDAMGTLFGLRNSVGEIYSAIASNYRVKADAYQIEKAFINSFKTSPPLAFSSLQQQEEITQQEYLWWRKIVQKTFSQLELLEQFTDFEAFFKELYYYFATSEPWYVYPDTIPTLQKWQQKNIQLGVISNFDSRLYQILELLELKSFFQSITISSLAGFAKPDPNIFTIALAKHHCFSEQVWHIGDSFTEDYQGAKKAEIKSFWLNRSELSRVNKN